MAAKKRSKEMVEWLRWLRLECACDDGVKWVRRFSSPQKAYLAMAERGYCGWMAWLLSHREDFSVGRAMHIDDCPHQKRWHFDVDTTNILCAASILKRYPTVPDWRGE